MKIKQLSIILITLLFFGCYKEYRLYTDENYKPLLVINSLFVPDSSIVIKISRSNLPTMLDTNDLKIKVDTLKLYAIRNGQKILIDKKTNFVSPYENTEYKVKPDEDYYVEVWAIDKKASAYIEIPDVVEPSNLQLSLTQSFLDSSFEDLFADLTFTATITIDDPDTENYYFPLFYYIYPFLQYSDTNFFQLDTIKVKRNTYFFPNLFSNQGGTYFYYDDFLSGLMFNDATFNGSKVSISGNFSLTYSGFIPDTIRIYFLLFTVSKDLYRYSESREKYDNSEYNPFVEPVNVYSNVKDGIGLCAGINYYFTVIKIPKTEILQMLD